MLEKKVVHTCWYCLYVHLSHSPPLLTAMATPSGFRSAAWRSREGTDSGGTEDSEPGEEEPPETSPSRRRTEPDGEDVVRPGKEGEKIALLQALPAILRHQQ